MSASEQNTKTLSGEALLDLKTVQEYEDLSRNLTVLHSRARREYLATEHGILARLEETSEKAIELINKITASAGIPPEERKLWAMDIKTGVLTKKPV